MIDQDFLAELQYALLEEPDGGATWASGVWTRAEVLSVANQGERTLLRRTHLVVTRTELAVLQGATSVTLPADWLATLHLVWRDTPTATRTPLSPADTTEIDLAVPTWETTEGRPQVYLDGDTSTLTLRLGPIPNTAGVVELLYVAVPTEVNGNGRSFTVPDLHLTGVKYAALGDLLRKPGRLQDPARAAYCAQRADLAVTAAEILIGGQA